MTIPVRRDTTGPDARGSIFHVTRPSRTIRSSSGSTRHSPTCSAPGNGGARYPVRGGPENPALPGMPCATCRCLRVAREFRLPKILNYINFSALFLVRRPKPQAYEQAIDPTWRPEPLRIVCRTGGGGPARGWRCKRSHRACTVNRWRSQQPRSALDAGAAQHVVHCGRVNHLVESQVRQERNHRMPSDDGVELVQRVHGEVDTMNERLKESSRRSAVARSEEVVAVLGPRRL